MDNLGELIDALRESVPELCIWMDMVCDETDPEILAQLRKSPVDEPCVKGFCTVIATQIQTYLVVVTTETQFNATHAEGHEFLAKVYELVKDKGIPMSSVCVPISYTDMAAQAGIVQVDGAGMVSLTERGETMAREALIPET